jgi:membrane protein
MTRGDAPRLAAIRRHATRSINRVLYATWRAVVEFVEDRGHRDAAQIGFFGLLSAIPLALLLVGAFGLIFDDTEIRDQVIGTVFDRVPLSTDEDRARLEETVRRALDNAGRLGPVSILLLFAAGSGVMSALRHAINQAWDISARPPLLRRKALDLALVLGSTVLLALSASVSVTRRAEAYFNEERTGAAALLFDALGDVLPFAFTLAVLLFLYRVLPMQRPRLREIWPGAVVATLLLAAIEGALEFYFEELTDLGALYGPLGALMALLLFVYAAANVLVFGAEFASEWSRLPADDEVAGAVHAARRRVLERTTRRRSSSR